MSAARYVCPSCKVTLKVANALPPGKVVKCPSCAATFRVPAAQAPASSPAPREKPGPAAAGVPAPAGRPPPRPVKRPAQDEPDEDEEVEERPSRRPAKEVSPDAPRRKAKLVEELPDEEPDEDEELEERPRKKSGKRGRGEPGKGRLALRVAVLTLAIVGSGVAGAFGGKWMSDARSPEVKALRDLAEAEAEQSGSKELKARVAQFDRIALSSYFVLAAVPLGIAGGVLTFMGRPWLGGGLMLATVPVPAVLSIITLGLTFFLLVGGGLSFLIRTDAPSVSGGSTAKVVWAFIGGGVGLFILWIVLLSLLMKLYPKPDRDTPGRQRSGLGADRRLQDRFSLELRPGELFGLLGPSGADKTVEGTPIVALDQTEDRGG